MQRWAATALLSDMLSADRKSVTITRLHDDAIFIAINFMGANSEGIRLSALFAW